MSAAASTGQSKGVVFITGASTGIGRACAERLARAGYDVIPGLRRDEPLPAPVLPPVLLDLADADSIAPACAEVVSRAGGRLVGLVNNAGINVSGPSEAVSIEDWRRQFEVNLFGHLAVTKALLPALLATRGRVVTVGSIGGRLSAPFLGPYSASKFAVRGWTDALRLELAPHGVRVVLVEPGAIATEMWRKGTAAADEQIAALDPEQSARYSNQVTRVMKRARLAERGAIPADRCAAVVEKALTASHPPGRILVGVDAHVQAVLSVLPTRALDAVLGVAMGSRRA